MFNINDFSSELQFLLAREDTKWGTYGKSGKEELRWVNIKDMEDSHIFNILIDVERRRYNIHPRYLFLFKKEIEFRTKNPRYSVYEGKNEGVRLFKIDSVFY
jgi:hypothetical protein